MSHKYENKTFHLGRMDLDSAPEFQENGTYGYALNVRSYNPENGSVGVITNINGNEVATYDFDLGDDAFLRGVGSHIDEKRRRLYWFVYGQDSLGNEKAFILYYSYEEEEVYAIFNYDNVLGFSPSTPILDSDIIYDDSLGDTLKWVSNGEPREINVTAGYNRFNVYNSDEDGYEVGDIVFADFPSSQTITNAILTIPCECLSDTNTPPSYDYTTGELTDDTEWSTLPVGACYPPYILETMFYQKTRAPYYSPNAHYNYESGSEDATGSSLFLNRKSYQFRYKYVMFDGQETEWSPISEAVFSQEPTSVIFSTSGSTVDINYPTPSSVSVRVPIGFNRVDGTDQEDFVEYPHAMIARVRIAIREVPSREAPEDWYLLDDIPTEEFWQYNISRDQVSADFPISGTAGTYYYNWDTLSYNLAPAGQTSYIASIVLDYDGSQTLTPLDAVDTASLYNRLPKNPTTQGVVDNRVVFGGGSDGITVPLSTLKSIEDNIELTLATSNAALDVEDVVTTLNTWDTTPTSVTISGATDNVCTIVFDLNEAINISEYDGAFYYDFEIVIGFNYRLSTGAAFYQEVRRVISGQSDGIPDEYADFEGFLEEVITDAYSDFTFQGTQTIIYFSSVSVDNSTGETTLVFNAAFSSEFVAVIPSIVSNGDFFTAEGFLPERTYKNHSTQQFGIVLQDETGRLSPVITGDWGRIEIPHYIDSSLDEKVYSVDVRGLEDIDVPDDIRLIHFVRKRSESYGDFIQFAISEDNCPQQSWNNDRQYSIGYINLELDSPEPLSADNKYLYVTLNSVNGGQGGAYESAYQASVLSFLPQQGDVVRFLYKQDDTGAIDERYETAFNILGYNEEFNTIVIDWNDVEDKEPALATYLENYDPEGGPQQVRILAEAIKKRTQSDQELYWEVAAQISCTNGNPDYNSQNKVGLRLLGDVYLKLRGYCINYTDSDNTADAIYENFVLQDRNYNDFSPSANVGEGRPNRKVEGLRRGNNLYEDVNRENVIRYSEKSIQEIDTRKYATFYSSSLVEQDNVFGRIEKIDTSGDRIDIYQEDKISYRMVGRKITTSLDGTVETLAAQQTVMSDPIYNISEYGISRNNTSFAKAGYRKYFTDEKRGMVYRQSMDGITPISEVGMSGTFKELFRKIRNSFTTPIIRGIVDERTDEYILSVTYSLPTDVVITNNPALFIRFNIPEGSSYFKQYGGGDKILIDPSQLGGKYAPDEYTVVGNQSDSGEITVQQKTGSSLQQGDTIRVSIQYTETLVYSERTGGWMTYLGYNSEWMETGIQSYHTFVDGQMWIHDIGNTDYNTFHDRQFPTEVQVYSNIDPQLIKEWKTLAVKSNFPNFSVDEGDIETSIGYNSYIPNASFTLQEGHYKAPFYRDSSTGDITSGRSAKLKGTWMKLKLSANETEINEQQLKLFGLMFNSMESPFSL